HNNPNLHSFPTRRSSDLLHQAGAATIRIVHLPELYNGKQVKDVSDFLNAGGTVDDLKRLYQAATLYVPPVTPQQIEVKQHVVQRDRKSTRLNSSHLVISY